jgi:cell wall-associated NlpC family hydrolase
VDAFRKRSMAVRMAALIAVVALIGALVLAVQQAARATPPPTNPSDTQLNTARANKTELANQVGALSAQVADLQNKVQQREAEAELAEQKLANALQKLQEAKAAAAAARVKLTTAQTYVDTATQQFRDFVRESYMNSPISGTAAGLLTAPDPNALLTRNDYLTYSAAHRLDVINRLSAAKVAQANADAAARSAEQRQTAATHTAEQARSDAEAALQAAQSERSQLNAKLASTQSALDAARLQLATLNNQRAQYVAWQKEQARIAAARAAAEARARAEAAAAAAQARAAAAAANNNSGSWQPPASSSPPPPTPAGGSWSAGAGQTAVSRAMHYLGIPYAFAGGGYSGPSYGVCVSGAAWNDCHVYGFDCSGLSMYAWAPYLQMDHFAATQYWQAGSYHPRTSALVPGDLVFWSSDGTQSGIHHVAIYIGGGNVIQAPQSGDIVRITPLGQVASDYFGATRPLT